MVAAGREGERERNGEVRQREGENERGMGR
jgi:hypothetical protein